MKVGFDPDYGKKGFALHLFRLRFRRLKLSQRQFADRFGIGYTTVRDVEQGKTVPARTLRVLVEAIARDPNGMAEAARLATHRRGCDDKSNIDVCEDTVRR